MRSTHRSRAWSRLAAFLAAMAAAIGLSALIAAPAQAAYSNCVGDQNGARVCFEPSGELLRVCDTSPDGHHASAAVRGSADSYWFEVGAYGGNDTCKTYNFDMPEDSTICYIAMVVEGDSIQGYYLPSSGQVSAGNGAVIGSCPYFDPDTVHMQ